MSRTTNRQTSNGMGSANHGSVVVTWVQQSWRMA